MLNPHQKVTGTRYTGTVALSALGLFFIPCAVMMSRTIEYATISAAAACSVLCVSFAWTNWKKSSQLSILSILVQPEMPNDLSRLGVREEENWLCPLTS